MHPLSAVTPIACGQSHAGSIAAGGEAKFSFQVGASESAVILSTCSANTDFDTMVKIYDQNSAPIGVPFDDTGACNHHVLNEEIIQTQLSGSSTPLAQGGSYEIGVTGYGGAGGNFELSVWCSGAASGGAAPVSACAAGLSWAPLKADLSGCSASCAALSSGLVAVDSHHQFSVPRPVQR